MDRRPRVGTAAHDECRSPAGTRRRPGGRRRGELLTYTKNRRKRSVPFTAAERWPRHKRHDDATIAYLTHPRDT
jgi:hypothetical protein